MIQALRLTLFKKRCNLSIVRVSLLSMKTLILDTSSEYALLAAAKDDKILFQTHLTGGSALSKSLGAEIKQKLDSYPLSYSRIVVGIGPGSFTGTRVGASMAQALAFGWNIPLYVASSLHAFAPANTSQYAVAIDARSGGVYLQLNQQDPQRLSLTEARNLLCNTPLMIASPHPSRILERLPELASCQWLETRPEALSLMRFASPAPQPLSLHYLSSP